MLQRHESTAQSATTYFPLECDKENRHVNICYPEMDGKERRNLLKSSFDVNFSHNCSSWLSNHPEGSSRNSRITPLTWSENVYRVEIKNDAVDLICVRRKFHQISNHDQRKTKSDGGNEPKKIWQIFGEGVGMSHSRSFSKRPAVASPPIPAPLNQPLRQCEPPPEPTLQHTVPSGIATKAA
jgi:hypothetical protein